MLQGSALPTQTSVLHAIPAATDQEANLDGILHRFPAAFTASLMGQLVEFHSQPIGGCRDIPTDSSYQAFMRRPEPI